MSKLGFLEDEFLVRRNANIPRSAISLLIGVEERCIWENMILSEIARIDEKWLKYETGGDMYTFKIRSGGWFLPYCQGINAIDIAKKSRITCGHMTYTCAKHGIVFMNHVLDIVLYLTHERTGAVGLNYLDLASSPYIHDRRDPLNDPKQMIEFYHYNVNKYTRYGSQSPFVNELIGISMGEEILREIELYRCGKNVGTALDYIDDAMTYLRHSLLSFLRGDACGRPLTFPIPSIYLTGWFLKLLQEYDMWELFWKVVALRGTFYFQNPKVSNPGDAYSFCCRLRISTRRIREKVPTLGRWVTLTGSIGYVGINMPRIAYMSRGDLEKALELVRDRLEVCRKVLNFLRRRYLEMYRAGLYPTTSWLIDDSHRLSDPFKTYFNTVAVIGLSEYMSIMYLENHDNSETIKLATMSEFPKIGDVPFISAWKIPDTSVLREMVDMCIRTLSYMKKLIMEYSDRDDVLYNLEQAPAEEAGIKLALMDMERLSGMVRYIPRDVDPLSGRVYPYYSNQNVPYYAHVPLHVKIWIEDEVCSYRIGDEPLFDGGYTMFINAPMYIDPEKVAKLCIDIVERTNIIYFSYKPVQTVCPNCGIALPGVYDECPYCGSREIEKWDRIVGYYRPIDSWNPGRRAEFNTKLRWRTLY